MHWLVGWLIHALAGWLVDSFIHEFIHLLVCGLVDWLND